MALGSQKLLHPIQHGITYDHDWVERATWMLAFCLRRKIIQLELFRLFRPCSIECLIMLRLFVVLCWSVGLNFRIFSHVAFLIRVFGAGRALAWIFISYKLEPPIVVVGCAALVSGEFPPFGQALCRRHCFGRFVSFGWRPSRVFPSAPLSSLVPLRSESECSKTTRRR